jgi:putative exporter of polyketide antibiotics
MPGKRVAVVSEKLMPAPLPFRSQMPPKQTTTLTSLFSKAVKAPSAETVPSNTVAVKTVATTAATATTATTVADIEAFYASLTPNERKAHAIAVTDLGTSYNVRATHGFIRWSKHRV